MEIRHRSVPFLALLLATAVRESCSLQLAGDEPLRSASAGGSPTKPRRRVAKRFSVPIVTVETRSTELKIPVPGVQGQHFHNLGVNQTWHGLFTKPKLFLQWLEAQEDPNKLVIFSDAADVLFGGCTEEELLRTYHSVARKSGDVPVVMGAELGLDPPPLGYYLDQHALFQDRRHSVQEVLALKDSSYGKHAICEIRRKDPTRCYVPAMGKVKQHSRWPCAGPCSMPPSLTFLNSGFIMGPVWALREVAAGMLSHEVLPADVPFRDNWHDQGAAALYMQDHPDKLTLDYTGSLVLNLHQLALNMSLEVINGYVHNKVTNRTQCFVHANGPALGKLNRTLTALDKAPWLGRVNTRGL